MHRVKHDYKSGFAGVLRPRNQEKINGSIMKYQIGQKVLIDVPVAYTGARNGNNYLVDSNGYQFWINKDALINLAKVYGTGKIIGVENKIYKVELKGSVFDCKEEYIKKSVN